MDDSYQELPEVIHPSILKKVRSKAQLLDALSSLFEALRSIDQVCSLSPPFLR